MVPTASPDTVKIVEYSDSQPGLRILPGVCGSQWVSKTKQYNDHATTVLYALLNCIEMVL